MHNKKFRIFATSLMLAVCMQTVFTSVSPTTVFAADYLPESLTDSYTTKATDYFKEIYDDFNQASSGQSGLLSKLDDIQQYAMVVYYLEIYQSNLNIQGCTVDGSELHEAVQDLAAMCDRFNKSYDKDSSSFKRLKLDLSDKVIANDSNLKTAIKKMCTIAIPDYTAKILKDVKSKSEGKAQDKILSSYGVLLSNVCSLLDNMDDMADNLTNISPYKSVSDLGNPIDFNTKLDLKSAYATLRKTYESELSVGEDVLSMQSSSSVISIDKSLEFVANMANVTAQDGNIVIPDGVQLSQAYLAILSAGATYVPFSSYMGESSFMSALKSLVEDDTAVQDLVDFYDDTKSFRKPLYHRNLSNEGVPTGKAELITVKDFLSEIEKGSEGALVTMAGKFTYDTKNNYWVYADTYSTNQDEDDANNPADDEDYSSNADDSLSTQEVSSKQATDAIEENKSSNNGQSTKVVRSSKSNASGSQVTIVLSSDSYKAIYVLAPLKANVTVENTAKKEKAVSESVNLLPKNAGGVLVDTDGYFGTYIKQVESELKIPDNYKLSNDVDAKEYLKTQSIDKKTNLKALKKLASSIKVNGFSQGASAKPFNSKKFNLASLLAPETVKATTVQDSVENQNTNTSGEASGEQQASQNTGSSGDQQSSQESTQQSTQQSSQESTQESTQQSTENQVTLTQETSTSISTSEVQGMSVSGKDVPGIMSDKTITSEDKMSEPILLYGAKHARATDNITTLLLRNIIKGTVGCKDKYPDSNDYLYVNAYGDILTDDGMIILPGIANPIFYNQKSKYNPYTAAFMNYYPTVLENTNFFQVATENDIGKMVILNDSAELKKDGSIDPKSLITNKAATITTVNDIKSTAPISMPEMETTFYYNKIEKKGLLGYDRLIFGDSSTWNKDGTNMYSYTPLLIKSQLSSGGIPIFPYNVADDRDSKEGVQGDSADSYSCAQLIAQDMFHYLTVDSSGASTNLGYLNDNYIVYYFCISNLNGTSNPLAYANADTYAYDRYVKDTETRKESTLLQVSKKILKSLGNVNQVIGIKTSSEDSILGPAFAFVKEHWLMCFMLLIVILLFGFARVRRDAFQSLILLGACVGFAYAFVYIIPNYLPLVYNSIINNVSENLAYETMAVKAETNDIKKTDVVAVSDDTGNYKNDTSSLTLYRVSSNKLQDFYNGLGITEADVVGGKTYVINQESGLYVEGDKIKINTDVLFKTLEISGSFDADTSNYFLEANKIVSNNVDYYTPYYDFVNHLIDKLNDLTTVYSIPRTMTKYSDDVLKDNYLVYSYTNSMPFLTPGVYDAYTPEDKSILTKEDIQTLLDNQKEVSDLLLQTFGDKDRASDWLGITDFFYNLDPEYQNTVWAQTMYDTGYYYYDSKNNTDWIPNKEKINDLCSYINSQTKKFVYSMSEQIGTLSDDVMIKIITLRELTAFTQYVSDVGHWLYPFSLNYQEMTLNDVMSSVLVSDYYTYVGQNLDICSYVLVEYGWFHLILFDALVILLFVICTVVHFAVPLMYLLLGILLVIKLVTNNDIKVPIKGYLKCTLLTMLCSTFLCAGIVLTNKLHNSVICIYFLIFVLIVIATILVTILTSLITNIADFGDTSLKAKVDGISNSFNKYRNSARSTTTNIFTSAANRFKRNNEPHDDSLHRIVNKYNNNRSVDDFYDDSVYDSYQEGPDYNRYDPEDDLSYLKEPKVTRSDDNDFN